MPKAAPRACNYQGCKEYAVNKGYCQAHAKHTQLYDRQRGTAHQRGYTSVWRKARNTYLSNRPLCKICGDNGIDTRATEVDHIVPHKGDQEVFWDSTNWQPLCKPCHSRKTASEDMGSWLPKND